MTIGLPIEIKVREYLGKMYLACKFVDKLNQDVIIGEKIRSIIYSKKIKINKLDDALFLLSKDKI